MNEFEPVGEAVRWRGQVIEVGEASYRFKDGVEVTYDRLWHPGAVTVLAVDHEHVWLVRQPREASGMSDSLETPAGKRDRAGEPVLALAQRELVEEIGKQASQWRQILDFYPTPGFSDERIWLFLATGLSDAAGGPAPEADERIEIVPWPLTQLDSAIEHTHDAKTLIALLWLARQDIKELLA